MIPATHQSSRTRRTAIARGRKMLAAAAGMALAASLGLPLGAAPATAAPAAQVATKKFATTSHAVPGPIGKRYRKLGGANGRLGEPIRKQRCHKPTGVCRQLVKRGAIIHDRDAVRKVVHAFGKPRRAAYYAVARAYVGYREPRVRGSKWNAWMNSDRAWCGYFNAWVSRASGNGNRYPKHTRLRKQVAEMRKRGTILKKPQRGAFMLINRSGGQRPGHAGLIMRVKKNGDVVTIDGNAPHPKSNTRKGRRYVVRRSQDTSQAVMYWRPAGW